MSNEHRADAVTVYMQVITHLTMKEAGFKLHVVSLTEWLAFCPTESTLRVVGTPFVLSDFDNHGHPTAAAIETQKIKNLPMWTMEGCYIKLVICGNFPIGIVSHDEIPCGAVADRVFLQYLEMQPSMKPKRLSLKNAFGKGLYHKYLHNSIPSSHV